jgi:drug/metabolite transporter (DMT)-like permease
VFSLALALIHDGSRGVGVPHAGSAWAAIGVTAVLGTAAGFFLQTWSQARMPATRAAVILTLEPVFAGATGVLTGEKLAPRGWLGAAFVLAAMYVVELAPAGAPTTSGPAGAEPDAQVAEVPSDREVRNPLVPDPASPGG